MQRETRKCRESETHRHAQIYTDAHRHTGGVGACCASDDGRDGVDSMTSTIFSFSTVFKGCPPGDLAGAVLIGLVGVAAVDVAVVV